MSFLASIAYLATAMWEICCAFVRTSTALGLWSFATSWTPALSLGTSAFHSKIRHNLPLALHLLLLLLLSILSRAIANLSWLFSLRGNYCANFIFTSLSRPIKCVLDHSILTLFSTSICSWRIITALCNGLPKPDTTHPDSQLGTSMKPYVDGRAFMCQETPGLNVKPGWTVNTPT